MSAAVDDPPALIGPTDAPPAETATGTGLPVLVPFPNSPKKFDPQQYACPALSTAHVWLVPELMAVRVLPDKTSSVLTAKGTLLWSLALLPSAQLPPQQYAFPALSRAHVILAPALIAVSVLPARAPDVTTTTGTLLTRSAPLTGTVTPLPS